jgi:predicted permease
MLTDLRYAFRQIAKSPGYTVVVVLTLALGIAVNTVIFGTVNSMFLQPLDVRDADRLVVAVERSDTFNMPHGLSFLDFQDIRAGSKTLVNEIAYFFTPAHLSTPGHKPERGWIEAVTPDAFDKMAVTVSLGRPLQPSDGELPPGVPVAVITHRYWENHFGSDPHVIGKTIIVNSHPLTIVGVAKPGFESFSWSLTVNVFVSTGAFAQLRADGEGFFKYRGSKAWRLAAYRAPGATIGAVNAELAIFAQRFAKDFPDDHRHASFQAIPEQRARPDPSVSEMMPVLIALFTGLCALVMLIACANVANLMGARALAREKEMVVRSALGATRFVLIRQLLIESLVVAVIAGIAGYILAQFGNDMLSHSIPSGDMPIRRNPPEGWHLYAFTTGISLLAGLLAGLMPALRSSRVEFNESLKQSAGRQIGSGRHRLRNLLVIGQVAVSCVVLVCSALFLRGLRAASSLDLGFRPDRLVMLSIDLGMQGYDETRSIHFMDQALERVRAIPGVESAAFSQHVPFNYNIQMRSVWPENPTVQIPDGHTTVTHTSVTPGYVKMMGVPLLQGRDLAESDDAKAPKVAVINDTMAKAFWPGRNPIGQHFRIDWIGGAPVEVVGVTTTGRYVMISEEPRPYFYVPQAQRLGMPVTLVVRAKDNPLGLISGLRTTIGQIDPDLPIYSLITLDEHLASSVFALMPLRTGATIAAAQGLIALGLAVMGLFAVVSYSVTSRTREIGLRMALGASRADVLNLISREGIRLTLTGLVIGLIFSVGAAFGLANVIYGVKHFDFVAYGAVIIILGATSAVACWLPARRATAVDPMVALRAE